MSINRRLQRASFRGAQFLFQSGERMGGRKSVTFEYPNKTYRFIEDQGGLLRVFNITGIISGIGRDYFQKRDALLNALEQAGPGQLVHPYYGAVNVFSKPYTLTESPTELGMATFSMVFEETREPIYPQESQFSAAKVNASNNSLFDKISSGIGSNWNVTNSFFGNFDAARDKLNNVALFFEDNTDTFVNAQTEVSQFFGDLTRFKDGIVGSISRPARLGTSITGLFKSVDNLGDVQTPILVGHGTSASNEVATTTTASQQRVNIAKSFFGFGANDTPIPQNTAGRIERNKNNQTINQAMNILALGNAYRSTVQVDYQTEDQAREDHQALDDQFDAVMEPQQIFDDETIAILKEMRDDVRKFFDNELINISRVQEVNIPRSTLTALTYQYYGSLDLAETIADLNKFDKPSQISGTVRILTQ